MQRIISITVLGLVTGSLAAFMAVGFVTLIEIADAGLIAPVLEQGYFRIHQWFAILAALVIGGIVVSLLRYWSRPEQPQGVAQTIAAAHGLENHMPMPTAFRSVLASLVSLTSGASVGQYGPLAHAGASLGLLFVKLIGRGPGTRSIAIACGVAAAISTAFHAPIAGVVFAHEVILRHYSLRAFAPVTVASSVGYLVARLVLDHEPLFVVSELVVIKSPEYLLFALIGVSGGLLAVLLMRFVTSAVTHAPRLPVAPWLQPPLAGVLLALLALTVPEVLGVGGGSMNAVLNGQVESLRLVWILLAKILATGLCLGLGYVGGLFSPALVVGVMFGALAGQATDWLFDSAFTDLVTYAVCGMVAVVSPVIGAPLTAILLIFELTGNYTITTAAMLSVVFSNLVSYRVYGRSYFDHQLLGGGCDMSQGREYLKLYNRSFAEMIDANAPRLALDASRSDALALLKEHEIDDVAIVDENNRYLGMLSLRSLVFSRMDGETESVVGLMDSECRVFGPQTTIGSAMEWVRQSSAGYFPVVGEDDDFVGVVSRRNLVAGRNEVGRQTLRETHGAL